MEPHDLDAYRMRWTHHASGEIITEEVYEDNEDDVIEEEYLVGEEIIPTNEINAISNTLDQSAAQNLIYMAQEGSVAMGDLIEEQVEQAENVDYNDQEYFECQVTEEVITDDWVQRQGEERIEIIIDSIENQAQEAGAPLGDDDIDLSLPTVQDEYTASRPYPCDFCSRRFRKKANLVNHMVAHQHERPHVCHLCHARYIRKSDLMQHLKIHAFAPDEQEELERPLMHQRSHNVGGKRPAKLSSAAGRGGLGKSKPGFDHHLIEDDVKLLCEVASQQQTSPHSHSENYAMKPPPPTERFPIIDDRRPFVCQQCGLSFAREKAMLSHSKSHAAETQLECEQCGETFYDVELLRQHEFSHTQADEFAEVEAAASSSRRRGGGGKEYRSSLNELTDGLEDFDDDDRDGTYVQEDEDEDEDEEHYQQSDSFRAFPRVNALRQLPKTHSRQGEQEHLCNVCGDSFAKALDLLAHAEVHAGSLFCKCLLCGEEKASDEKLQQHVQTMHFDELTEATCGVCGKLCREPKALQRHQAEKHPNLFGGHGRGAGAGTSGAASGRGKVGCQICQKTFQNKARLKRHLLSHRKRTVQCDLCLELFPDGRSLMNHRHSHTAGLAKKFPCKECGKSFGSRSSQQIHVRMHTGERPYACRFCWKSFADGGTLRKHERIHTGEKPYGCVVCPRAFNQRVVLREHIRSHHSGPDPSRSHTATPYYCQLCHESYVRAEDLISDLIAHCDENTKRQRPIQVGPRKYKRRRKLKAHEIQHMSERGGACEQEDPTGRDSDMGAELLAEEPQRPMRSTSGKRRGMAMDEYYGAGRSNSLYLPAYEEDAQQAQQLGHGDSEEQDLEQVQETLRLQSTRSTRTRNGGNASTATAGKISSADLTSSSGRPKMIHTEKARVAQGEGRRKATLVTTRTAVTAAPARTATRRTRRGCGESEEEEELAFPRIKREIETPRATMPAQIMETDEKEGGLAMSSLELADVLENKKHSDKYSLDIVNDLESILCSPIRPRISESSTTGPDFILSGMLPNEVEVTMEDIAPAVALPRARRTIIECRRTYLPSSSEEQGGGARKRQAAASLRTKQYTAKIAAESSGYGIVRVKSEKGAGGRSAKVLSARDIYSTTEDEAETLDDFLHLGSPSQRSRRVALPPANNNKASASVVHKCEICNEVMQDKYELMNHAKTHF